MCFLLVSRVDAGFEEMKSGVIALSITVLLLVVVSLGAWLGRQHRKDEGHDVTKRRSPLIPNIVSNRTDGIQHVGGERQCKGGVCQADRGSGNSMDDNDDEDGEDGEDGIASSWLPLTMYKWPVPTRKLVPTNKTDSSEGSRTINGGNDTVVIGLWDADPSLTYLASENGCREKINHHAGRNFCQEFPKSMPSIIEGVHLAVNEATRVLRQRRWDGAALKKPSVGQNLVRRATKESAFTHAIISAGITHSVAKACSRGEINACGCLVRNQLPTDEEGVFWGGCSDNAYYGANVSAKFLNTLEGEPRDLHTKVNLHNNKAGRLVVLNQVRNECKCHGTSGSCSLQTCWKVLSPFPNIGNHIVRQYDHAVQVAYDNIDPDTPLRVMISRFIRKEPDWFDLVYYEMSPPYCVRNKLQGSLGTKGRKCNSSSQGTDSCLHLCCSRGFRLKYEVEVFQCHCVFMWCCKVQCKTCKKKIAHHVCR
jgi:hypothetical protein